MLQKSKDRFNPRNQAGAGDAPKCVEVLLVFQEEIESDIWKYLEKGISVQEKNKAGQFVFSEDKRACVAAHWLKRRMLSRADPSIDPLSWNFEFGVHGKPLVAGRSDLHFNLSHCKGLVACALRRDGSVGIDVEFTDQPAPREVAAHYFSELEAAWWRAQPEAVKTRAFFNIWTMKEAFVKATGSGLSHSIQNFSVCAESLSLLSNDDLARGAQSWRFHLAEPSLQHLLALAWSNEGARNEIVDVSVIQPDTLLGTT